MSKMGQGNPIGNKIGVCAECHNKAEVAVYSGGNPQAVCEDCYKADLLLQKKIAQKNGAQVVMPGVGGTVSSGTASSSVSTAISFIGANDERQRYLDVIQRASPSWVDGFIKEVMVKRVLQYDWKEIVKSERWFSVLDLRRFALEVDPDFEKSTKQVFESSTLPVRKRERKPRASRATVGA